MDTHRFLLLSIYYVYTDPKRKKPPPLSITGVGITRPPHITNNSIPNTTIHTPRNSLPTSTQCLLLLPASCSPARYARGGSRVQSAPNRPLSSPGRLKPPAEYYSLSRSLGARVSFHSDMSDPPAISTLDVRSGHAVCIIAPDVRCPPQWCALNMICGGRGGAPCLRAAALSSLPACAPSPIAARNLPRSSFAPAARARTCALTLYPLRLARDVRGFLFGRPAARSPLSSLFACGAPPALFPPLGVRAPLRSRSPRRALLLSRCAVRLLCIVSYRGWSRSKRVRNHAESAGNSVGGCLPAVLSPYGGICKFLMRCLLL